MLNGDVGYKYLRRKTKEERTVKKGKLIEPLPDDPKSAISIMECRQDYYPVTSIEYKNIQEQIDNYKIKHKIGVRIPQGNTIK